MALAGSRRGVKDEKGFLRDLRHPLDLVSLGEDDGSSKL